MLVDDATVLQHQPDRAADLPGVDVLLHEPVDARQASGRKARLGLCGQARRCDAQQRQRYQPSTIHFILSLGPAVILTPAARRREEGTILRLTRSAATAHRRPPPYSAPRD